MDLTLKKQIKFVLSVRHLVFSTWNTIPTANFTELTLINYQIIDHHITHLTTSV